MRTRRSYFPPTSTFPHRSRKQTTNIVEHEFRTIVEMADNRTMAQMLKASIEGYEDAIVVPQINTNNFKLKQTLINLVQSNQFTGRQDPHNHLRFFNKVTSTFRHPEVPNTAIKLLLFHFSLEGRSTNMARQGTSEINFDLGRSTKAITTRSGMTYKEPPIPPPGMEEQEPIEETTDTKLSSTEDIQPPLVQVQVQEDKPIKKPSVLDTFYNAINPNDQDALDSAAERNFLDKIPRECLSIIESKSKVRYSRSRITDVRANTNAPLSSSSPSNSFDLQQIVASLKDKLDIRMNRFEKSLNDMKKIFRYSHCTTQGSRGSMCHLRS
nr:hypothetical protein [Tanacetum cinerariifolium]